MSRDKFVAIGTLVVNGFVVMFLGSVVVMMLVFMVGLLFGENRYVCARETVLEIGACDKFGTCGVATKRGYETARFPVVGQMIEVCRLNGK